ncbi:MAG: ATP-dependent DNA helicase [Planctomycetota bacterium]
MTPSDELDALLGPDGIVSKRLSTWEPRPQQLELAHAVMRAVDGGEHLLAEAGTGIGKSFAYLVPAVLHALAHPGRGPIVVSTRTIALQEQLEQKDLPFLHAVLPLEWSSVTAVGRSHYICLRRMHLASRERGNLFDDATREAQLDRIVQWASRSHGGLRFELTEPVDDEVWDEVRAEQGNCLYKACPHYDGCPYQRARRRLETAQIVVVNHALYCADIALRMAGARYLPDHDVVIFDEAHHLERIATEALGLRLGLGSVLWHLRRLRPRRARRGLLDRAGAQRSLTLIDETRGHAEAFFAMLDARVRSSGGATLALEPDDVLDESVSAAIAELCAELFAAAMKFEEVDLRTELQARARGLQALSAAFLALRGPCPPESVRWVEADSRGASLRSAPLSVGDALARQVFAAPRSAILVSATLAPDDDPQMEWLATRLGVGERRRALRVGSPFDYRRNVRVRVPEAMPDPTREADAFLRRCREEVRERVIANGGRALVLCTSWSFVRAIADELRDGLEPLGIPVLVQGDAPMRELLRRKRDEPTSVLIGADSLWEGIDVPGDALTLVVITRLPFAQPDHPLTRARVRAITARGGDAFAEHSLPEAVLRFRQGFGRLVRRTDDRGEVVVLDPRVRTKVYGRAFLRALPEGVLDADDEHRSR